MVVTLYIAGTTKTHGTTFYLIKVCQDGEGWVVQKRFNDFLALDALLTSCGSLSHIALPQTGALGLRHRFNHGSFNERRLQSLEQYLMFLAQQVQSVTSNEHLDRFLQLPAPTYGGDPADSVLLGDLFAPLPEPTVRLLPQVPIAVHMPTVSREGSRVQYYHVKMESPGVKKCVRRQHRDFQELHQSLQSTPFGSQLPALPSFSTFGSEASKERLRIQLEAYLSFLCRHPLVLLDDALWNWLEASAVTKCVVRMVVTNALGHVSELGALIEELLQLLSEDGTDRCCVSPAILEALSAPFNHATTTDETCLNVCRVLKRLVVRQRVRHLFLPQAGGGVALLLKAHLRGGEVAEAVQLVFEACGGNPEEDPPVTSLTSSLETFLQQRKRIYSMIY